MGISDENEEATIASDETTISQIKVTIYKLSLLVTTPFSSNHNCEYA